MTKYIFAIGCATIVIAIIQSYSFIKNREKKRLFNILIHLFKTTQEFSKNEELFSLFTSSYFFNQFYKSLEKTVCLSNAFDDKYKYIEYKIFVEVVEFLETINLRMELVEIIINFQKLKKLYPKATDNLAEIEDDSEFVKNELINLNHSFNKDFLYSMKEEITKRINNMNTEEFRKMCKENGVN